VPLCQYEPDFNALRTASTRIVIGVGAESANAVAGRAAIAVADRLGTIPMAFPGGHDGFLGGEYGQTGVSDAFAATLREVLAGNQSLGDGGSGKPVPQG
jgi:hypothetical protein